MMMVLIGSRPWPLSTFGKDLHDQRQLLAWWKRRQTPRDGTEKRLAAGDQSRDFGKWLDLRCQYRRGALIDAYTGGQASACGLQGQARRIAGGIFDMNQPTITCPHCKAEVRFTEGLATPLISGKQKDC